jgi:CDP-glycerol glycerophosphotransferase (TagB/SpsB family)
MREDTFPQSCINFLGVNHAWKLYSTNDGNLSFYFMRNKNSKIISWEQSSGHIAVDVQTTLLPGHMSEISYTLSTDSGRHYPLDYAVRQSVHIGELEHFVHRISFSGTQIQGCYHGSSMRLEIVLRDESSAGRGAVRASSSLFVRNRPFTEFSTILHDGKPGDVFGYFSAERELCFTVKRREEFLLLEAATRNQAILFRVRRKTSSTGERSEGDFFSDSELLLIFEDGEKLSCVYHAENAGFLCPRTCGRLVNRPFRLLLRTRLQGESPNVYNVPHGKGSPKIGSGFLLLKSESHFFPYIVRSMRDVCKEKIRDAALRSFLFFCRYLVRIVKKSDKKPVWLIGEYLSQTANDNGFAFFRYMESLGTTAAARYFYVATRECMEKNALKNNKRICVKDSFKHIYLFARADKCLVTTSMSDILPSYLHTKHAKNKKQVWYLDHGVVAMKTMPYNKNSYNKRLQKFIVSSEMEKGFLAAQLGERLLNIGLCRYDCLRHEPPEKKFVLIMPTWQESAVEEEPESCASFKNLAALLTDAGFIGWLRQNAMSAVVVMHKFMKAYQVFFEHLSGEDVTFASPEHINVLIRQCTLLITDYSSVAVDVAWLRKPVVFFRPDHDRFLHERGMYIREEDLFGYKEKSVAGVLAALNVIAAGNFASSLPDDKKVDRLVEWRDRGSCARLYKALLGKQ